MSRKLLWMVVALAATWAGAGSASDEADIPYYYINVMAPAIEAECQALTPGFAAALDANLPAWRSRNSLHITGGELALRRNGDTVDWVKEQTLKNGLGQFHDKDRIDQIKVCDNVLSQVTGTTVKSAAVTTAEAKTEHIPWFQAQASIESLRDRCSKLQPDFLPQYNANLKGWWSTNRGWIKLGARQYLAHNPGQTEDSAGRAFWRANQDAFDKLEPAKQKDRCNEIIKELVDHGVKSTDPDNFALSVFAPAIKADCQVLYPGYDHPFDAALPAWTTRNASSIDGLRKQYMAKTGKPAEQAGVQARESLLAFFRAQEEDGRRHVCDAVLARLEYIPPSTSAPTHQ